MMVLVRFNLAAPELNRPPPLNAVLPLIVVLTTVAASAYLMVAPGVWQTFRIVDTNPSAVCKC